MFTDNRSGGIRLTLVYVLGLAVLSVLLRLAPYWLDLGPGFWNLMPVGALALFAGSRLRSWVAWVAPLAAMLVADLLLIYPLSQLDPPCPSFTWGTPVIYLSYLLYVAIGRLIRAGELSPPVIGGAALLASAQFFVLTNLATWPALYPLTLQGLRDCFLLALPFYKGTVISDLVCTGLIFGGHAMLAWALTPKQAPVLAWRRTSAWEGSEQVVRRDEVSR